MPSPKEFIPLCAPVLAGEEWTYVKECLDTGWVSAAGGFVNRFEDAFAEAVGAKGAVACASGTAALHLALIAAGVQPGTEVIVPSLTFIAPVNTIRYVGAFPVFIDADADTWQIDCSRVRNFLQGECDEDLVNKTTGRKVSAILPVHILGYCANQEDIYSIANEFGLAVIEDSTESLGAKYEGKLLGSESTFSCFSFNGNKLMTTGNGGMLTSKDPEILRLVKHLSTQSKADNNEYIHDEVGFNYRLPNVLAALGYAQLEQLPKFIARKHEIAVTYNEAFASNREIRFIQATPGSEPVEWLYTIKLDQNSRPLVKHLREQQIESRPLWQPNHLSQAHRDAQKRPCPVSEALYDHCISLPCSSNLTSEQQNRVISTVKAFLSN